MEITELSTCFCTPHVADCRTFYETHFAAEVFFDCGWYVNLRFGAEGPTLQFMQPQGGMPPFGGAGVTLNVKVVDVDAEHDRLTAAGLAVAMPLEDHPWGDRGFSVLDPIGNAVYLYENREPAPEFQDAYR